MSDPAAAPAAGGSNIPGKGRDIAAFSVGCLMLAGLFYAAIDGRLPPNLVSR
jgi:hypothetical protein